MHQAIRAGNAEIAKAILPIDICSHRRCALRMLPIFHGLERVGMMWYHTGVFWMGARNWHGVRPVPSPALHAAGWALASRDGELLLVRTSGVCIIFR